jgi:hypothetical protein
LSRPERNGRQGAAASRLRAVATTAAAIMFLSTAACAVPAGPVPADTAAPQPGVGVDPGTVDDAEFARTFRHEFADVDGLRMHYVTGGSGPALVLLHGWPQTWFVWRGIMPALAERFTVYAVDLPGLGDSEGAPPCSTAPSPGTWRTTSRPARSPHRRC